MDEQERSLIEKIRQQFDFGPYPGIPIDRSPKDNVSELYIHNFVTPYYLRNQKVIDTEQITILDAGCGAGYRSLILAEANPGAKIVGIDISEKSLALASQRLKHHGFEQVEFYQLSIYELPQLGLEFDYINCDELLYLFPDPAIALQSMKSVLKPWGIIRSNLHSKHQRVNYFRAQEAFQMMGLMDGNPEDMEIEIVLEIMKALKDGVNLKANTWNSKYEGEEGKGTVLMNYLFQGDKGYTISDLFAALRAAELEFISMVNWRQWDLMKLFKEPENLPVFLAMSLPDISEEQRLRLFELLHPIHRLLDFWCGHPHRAQPFIPIAEWTNDDWQEARVHLHPQLRTPAVKEEMSRCVTQLNPFEISKHLPVTGESRLVDSTIAACLLPLLESPKSMPSLVARWQKLRPVHPVTLESTSQEEALETVKQALTGLEENGYVLVERAS
ncbi:Methyltransferase domain family [Coleofasciculus chthonoplastes PCC 7420]|uniref:Methyltransferase domain family n=1 Tax=Coleofasciculus chthonoplastes PCC 7420 TaxID=118168 RepID=B4VTE6_9CYAN|nr:class I SAM-dependent methyltransferase [Coleofasciculus chthonoplastes]EDX74970.1 Methyltransferase domain family [Coleofasciculus chthonoplastes PCC 7420]